MKKAVIIIRPNMYHQTKAVLEKTGFNAFSAMNVYGRGKAAVKFTSANANEQKQSTDYHRFIAKKMIVIVINDDDEAKLVKAIIDTNRTNHAGDGKIFIIPVTKSIRIRTGESGVEALV
jgi:nitrogen regulatory protein PII 2